MLIDNIIINNKKKFYNDIKKINKYSKKNEVLMGIDFEFNTKKIALMQIVFEIRINNKIKKKYHIIYPPNLDKEIIHYLKMNILSNKRILKILHGAESLDIPYIVEDLYNYDIIPLIDFFLSMVDTRYLCEYLNLTLNKPNICSIYEMLLNFDIIDIKIKNKLEKNETKMGPIYDIFIDINNLSKELILYSIYDIIYLVKAYETLKINIIKENPKNYYILIDCIRFSYMEKRSITNIGEDVGTLNIMNNYFIHINITGNQKEKVNLIKIFNIIIDKYKLIYCGFNNIININYIKSNILTLIKYIIYLIISNKFKVYASNTELNKYDLTDNYKLILEYLNYLEFNHLLEFINEFYSFTDNFL